MSRDPETAARLGAWPDLMLALGHAIAAGEALREADSAMSRDAIDGARVRDLTLEALAHLSRFDAEIQRIGQAPGPAEILVLAKLKARRLNDKQTG